jgi:hypothetical protein
MGIVENWTCPPRSPRVPKVQLVPVAMVEVWGVRMIMLERFVAMPVRV